MDFMYFIFVNLLLSGQVSQKILTNINLSLADLLITLFTFFGNTKFPNFKTSYAEEFASKLMNIQFIKRTNNVISIYMIFS